MNLDDLSRILDPIRRRVRLLISRGSLTAPADDSQGTQRVDVALLADEERTGISRVQQYGFTSVPPKDSEVVCLAVGGVREHLVVIAVDASALRPTGLKEGESALWTKKHGVRVLGSDDGHVDLGTTPSDFVALAAKVKAELDAIKADLDALKNHATTHTHSVVLNTLTATPTSTPASLSWSPGSVAAEEVRAK